MRPKNLTDCSVCCYGNHLLENLHDAALNAGRILHVLVQVKEEVMGGDVQVLGLDTRKGGVKQDGDKGFNSQLFRFSFNFHLFKDNMEYLQHEYMWTWAAFEPFILCLSCNKWSCQWYLSKLLKRMKCCYSTKMLQRINMQSNYLHRKAYVGQYYLCNICQVANTKIMIIF